MLPVIVPTTQEYVLVIELVNVILGLEPLHIVDVFRFVTTEEGLTVTNIVDDAPTQLPVVDVGVTIYSTVPAVAFGLVKT